LLIFLLADFSVTACNPTGINDSAEVTVFLLRSKENYEFPPQP